jgi:hypothetical protein
LADGDADHARRSASSTTLAPAAFPARKSAHCCILAANGERGPGAVWRAARQAQGPFIRGVRRAAETETLPRYSWDR